MSIQLAWLILVKTKIIQASAARPPKTASRLKNCRRWASASTPTRSAAQPSMHKERLKNTEILEKRKGPQYRLT